MKKTFKASIDGRKLETNEIIDAVLDYRGIDDLASFLKPSKDDLVPFEEMIGLHEAYTIIEDAILMGERFLVHYDIDCDGVSGGTIITRYLQARNADVKCAINKGKKHGVSDFDLDLLKDVDVMIVVDSIDNDPDVYRRITDAGVRLCVLDHHIPERRLLESDVPFILVSSANYYPNKELSGAGVALKFVQFCDYMNLENYTDELGLWLYGALGIVADMCSVENKENRYIVHRGLGYYDNPMIKKAVGNYAFDSTSISFSIAPLINACMRTNHNETAMNVFLTDDESEIGELINQMKQYKEEQNYVVDALMEELILQAESQLDKKCMFFTLPSHIEAEVTGLLGNKLLAMYQRPLFVLRDKIDVDDATGEIIKHELSGSMRATGVENMLELANNTGLCACYGHPLASGAFIDADKFELFKETIEDVLKDVALSVEIEADIELTPDQINEELIKNLNAINKISGSGFPPIKVLVRSSNYQVDTFSSKKHLKIIDETGMLIVKWNCMDWQTLHNDKEVVAIGVLANPFYGRNKFLQLTVDEYAQQDASEISL